MLLSECDRQCVLSLAEFDLEEFSPKGGAFTSVETNVYASRLALHS